MFSWTLAIGLYRLTVNAVFFKILQMGKISFLKNKDFPFAKL